MTQLKVFLSVGEPANGCSIYSQFPLAAGSIRHFKSVEGVRDAVISAGGALGLKIKQNADYAHTVATCLSRAITLLGGSSDNVNIIVLNHNDATTEKDNVLALKVIEMIKKPPARNPFLAQAATINDVSPGAKLLTVACGGYTARCEQFTPSSFPLQSGEDTFAYDTMPPGVPQFPYAGQFSLSENGIVPLYPPWNERWDPRYVTIVDTPENRLALVAKLRERGSYAAVKSADMLTRLYPDDAPANTQLMAS